MTGLAIFLPVLITYVLVMFLINLLTAPFSQATSLVFNTLGVQSSVVLYFLSQLFVLLFIFFLILATGLLASVFLVQATLRRIENLVLKIPIFNTFYVSLQEVMVALFSPESPSFSKVVLVPYPHKGIYSIGLIAEETLFESVVEGKKLVSVFLPGVPNPTYGYMLTFPQDEILTPDITVPEAIKMILSFGVIYEK